MTAFPDPRWFAARLLRRFRFLVRDHGFTSAGHRHGGRLLVATFTRPDATFEIMWDDWEGILSGSVQLVGYEERPGLLIVPGWFDIKDAMFVRGLPRTQTGGIPLDDPVQIEVAMGRLAAGTESLIGQILARDEVLLGDIRRFEEAATHSD